MKVETFVANKEKNNQISLSISVILKIDITIENDLKV